MTKILLLNRDPNYTYCTESFCIPEKKTSSSGIFLGDYLVLSLQDRHEACN